MDNLSDVAHVAVWEEDGRWFYTAFGQYGTASSHRCDCAQHTNGETSYASALALATRDMVLMDTIGDI